MEISEKPDYIFFHETSYDYLNYRGIRINYTGENISANFNLSDYAIGFDYLNFNDRYYRLPIYLVATFYREKELALAKNIDLAKNKLFTKDDLAQKTDFCSFVYSNYLSDHHRETFFNQISQYKRVNSGGKYLNNTGETVDNKLEFESKHKFSIAFENSSRSGYTTEKIVCALMANTIPIYWGNPEIGKEFNTKRFINCHDYGSFDEILEKVKELDQNDGLYLQMINETVFANNYNPKKVMEDFENFLKNIFDQNLEKAYRRTINPIRAIELERNEKIVCKYNKKRALIRKMMTNIYKPFKKIKYLEKAKQNLLKIRNDKYNF